MQEYIDKAAVLIEAVPYIQDFSGSLVVVKVGGSVQESPENLMRLLSDIAFMRTVGIKVILVHGGGKAISRAMEQAGIAPNFVQGLRVTDEATIEVVEKVIKHEVNANILRLLNNNFHVLARPLHGDWIFTVRKVTGTDAETGEPLDWGYVGEPVKVKTEAIAQMTDAGVIPVITPLGVGEEAGMLYNVNADIAAVAIAKAMRVRKLVFISDVPGLLRDINDPGSLFSTLHLGDVQTLKDEGVIRGGMLPKIDSCVEAIEAGVQRVHLVDGRMPHSLLLEIFTKQGVGTEIKADE
ncbi:MAG: acetylglutamate kinase [Kiritimatiellae bacterium]|nr:acetylglutamate kinase [Kiritimatiellia bacterium]MBR4946692.1 acetylglutamate kinase [Kiritimatiellia bacterium]MBR5587930.1 acetylglutamate kinase [Kiritimatiellia bacterium]